MNFAELRSVKPHRVRRVKVTEYKVISTRGKPRVFLAQGLLITDKIRDVECPVFAFPYRSKRFGKASTPPEAAICSSRSWLFFGVP